MVVRLLSLLSTLCLNPVLPAVAQTAQPTLPQGSASDIGVLTPDPNLRQYVETGRPVGESTAPVEFRGQLQRPSNLNLRPDSPLSGEVPPGPVQLFSVPVD
ncbi:MAG: hypothetical protein IGQ88_04125 [Gloeomargaritaceae cyanobacterium C42_A2020_066]|nr:hypothetical protein [Gloeomargaritaceae cyanobacterium C42_A2020_066]